MNSPTSTLSSPRPAPACVPPPVPRWASTALLQGRREVEIEHAGHIYRLRLTTLGKLILTK